MKKEKMTKEEYMKKRKEYRRLCEDKKKEHGQGGKNKED